MFQMADLCLLLPLANTALGQCPGAGGEAASCSKGVTAASWPGVLQSFLRSLGVTGVPVGRDESLCAPVQAGRCSQCLALHRLVHGHPCPGRAAGGSCISGAGQGMLFPRENGVSKTFLYTGNLVEFAMQESKEKGSVTN